MAILETVWQKIGYPLRLELVPLSLLGLTWYVALSAFPTLPPSIPTHFGITGTPDDWGSKSSIFVFVGISTALYVLFTVINVWFALVSDPRRLINLPRSLKANLTDAQAEELRTFLNRCLFGMKVLILALDAYSVYITIEVALGRACGLDVAWFLFLAAVLGLAVFMVWRSIRTAASVR